MSEGKTSTSEAKIPITIAMSSGLLFKQEQDEPGLAFDFVEALNTVNAELENCNAEKEELFKVILIDDSSSTDFVRDQIRINELGNLITVSPWRELNRDNIHLYLCDDNSNLQEAVNEGRAAAIMKIPERIDLIHKDHLRFAFDGIGVLFSNEQEPMNEGPFKGFLEVLIKLQKKFRNRSQTEHFPIRTYLVTSQSAGSDGYKVLKTLHQWDLELDEAVFLGEEENKGALERISPHVFFTPPHNEYSPSESAKCLQAWVLSNNE